MDCIFCSIIAGDIPATVLAESEHAIAIQDINPRAPLHALVIPRAHAANAAASAAADPAVVGHLVSLADEVAKAAGHPAYNLLINTGAEAGQTVFHTHVHVLAGIPIAAKVLGDS